MSNTTTAKYEARLQQHAVFMQQKARILFAFAATILFLCIENVKAFTAPLSKPDTLLFMASGAHSVAKRWRTKPATLTIRQTTQDKPLDDQDRLQKEPPTRQNTNNLISRTHCNKVTCMSMAFNFGSSSTNDSPPTLDMKTSLNAFGSWYNKMDPVARPPDYDDDETDYTLASPADDWPTSFEEEAVLTSTTAYLTNPRTKSKAMYKTSKRPRPIRTIRRIAGWFLGSSPVRNARGFSSQAFL